MVGAYAELKPENVTVSDLNGRTWRGSVGSADEIRYRSMKRASEQDLKAKILGVLSHIPGVTVEVNVELDREQAAGRRRPIAPPISRRGSPAGYQGNRPGRSDASADSRSVAKVLDSLLSGSSGEKGENKEPDRARRRSAGRAGKHRT